MAEHAVRRAADAGQKAFYTTPIKALSNQKFTDLVAEHGAERVGLLTGDNAVNGDAPIVVMTTEVLRNMIYAGSPALRGLGVVVLDEVHYLQDPYRGPVWEEVIIHLPREVTLVCLSATVSNADELAAWISEVRGPTATVVEERRPVELTNLYVAHDRANRQLFVVPTLAGGRPNPAGERLDADLPLKGRPARGRPRRRFATPRRIEMVEYLAAEDLLPAIYFVFSRAGCDDAAMHLLDSGVRLTSPDERARIRSIAEDRTATLSDGDLDVLDYDRWLAALELGIAAHHAGMVPPFKEAVEACFVQGLVKCRVRHRDPRPRDQHAGPVGRDRGALEVHRRPPRAPHARGVHAADGTGRAAGHRHRRSRLRVLVAVRALRPGRRPRAEPALRAVVVVPPHLQHDRQPRAPLRARRGPPAAQPLLRPVPVEPLAGVAGGSAGVTAGAARALPAGRRAASGARSRSTGRCCGPTSRPARGTRTAGRSTWRCSRSDPAT